MTSAARSSEPTPRRGSDKLAQQTARTIEAEIIRRRWPIGTLLGSETELCARYGVSRAVLREAIRLLEHRHVATMRRGPSGGLFLRAPDPSGPTHALVIYLESVQTRLGDLITARKLIESLAVRLSVERLQEKGIARLRAVLAQDAKVLQEEGMSGSHLHTALGQLSGNIALELFIDILVQLSERYLPAPRRGDDTETGHAAEHAHHAIAEAIIGGDVGAAQHRLHSHLDAMGDWLATQASLTSDLAPDTILSASTKLAEVVAERIRRMIFERGLQPGDLLGSERDLLARYEVSRSVLREAVRLLEFHSVAMMRRGPGGGLIVAEPDPQASIETIGLYLDYKQIQVDELRVLRETLELGCVELAALRLEGDADGAARLRNSLLVDAHTPENSVLHEGTTFHTEVAELSGNPVLSVFLRVLMDTWVRHSAALPADQSDGNRRFAPEIAAAHGAITEAVLAGDTALAKHRMRRHLGALTEVWRP